jgi:cardiolipin synthase A/B
VRRAYLPALASFSQLSEHHRIGMAAVAPDDRHIRASTRGRARHAASQVVRAIDFAARKSHDDVSDLQAAPGSRRSLDDLGDHGATSRGKFDITHDVFGDRHHPDPQIPSGDLTVLTELKQDVLGQVDGDGEADTDGPSRLGEDRRVDPYHCAASVDEGTAGIAGIDRCVGLDEVVVGTAADEALLGADDPRGDGLVEAERVTDRHHRLAHLESIRIAQRHRGEPTAVDLEQGNVGLGIAADETGVPLAQLGKADRDLVGLANHVVVGDDIAIGGDHEPGAEAAAFPPRRYALEEAAEELLCRRHPRLTADGGPDVDYPRLHHSGQLDPDPEGLGSLTAGRFLLGPKWRRRRRQRIAHVDADRQHPADDESSDQKDQDDPDDGPAHHSLVTPDKYHGRRPEQAPPWCRSEHRTRGDGRRPGTPIAGRRLSPITTGTAVPRRLAASLVHILCGAVVLAGCATLNAPYSVPVLRVGEGSFFATLEAYTQVPIVGDNRVEILLNGDEIFPTRLDAVRSARHTITFAQYYYEDGPVARDIAEALAERCRAGVGVNVLLDAVGSFFIPSEFVELMQRSGCHVAWFRPLRPWQIVTPWLLARYNYRLHRRITVIDGRIGFTGGSGISAKWMGNGRTPDQWRETDVMVEGPVVQQLQAAFAESWLETTGMVLGGDAYFPRLEARGTAYAQAVRSSPIAGAFQVYMLFLLSIESARRSIYITNPYFVPDARMEEALVRAVRRGVRVVLLVPAIIDHNLVRQASRGQWGPFLKAGIEIYEYRAALLHSKTMVVDGIWATVGSTNLDNRSFALNEELNLTIYDPAVARRLEQIFHDDLEHASRVTYRKWSARGIFDRLLELVTLPFRDQL